MQFVYIQVAEPLPGSLWTDSYVLRNAAMHKDDDNRILTDQG
jgi:hypothetical protein